MSAAPPNAERHLEILREELQVAIEIELTTIPPYLSALFSIPADANKAAQANLHNVVMEEMLHMTLAANVLNAVGGTPKVGRDAYVPAYPTDLPWYAAGFLVGVEQLSQNQIDIFCMIEQPEKEHPLRDRPQLLDHDHVHEHGAAEIPEPPPPPVGYTSLGQFYAAVLERLHWLVRVMGSRKVFTGDPARQVTREQYYGGGGKIVAVHDLRTAVRALREIVHQGEGTYTSVWDGSREKAVPDQAAHFYLFDEIRKGRHYRLHDKPDHPTGAEFSVDWNAVYPSRPNPVRQQYVPAHPEIASMLGAFDELFLDVLDRIGAAYDGKPDALRDAVSQMYRLRASAVELIRVPDPIFEGRTVGPSWGSADPGATDRFRPMFL